MWWGCILRNASLSDFIMNEHHRAYLHKTKWYNLPYTWTIQYSLLLLVYKPTEHVNLVNTAGSFNTVVFVEVKNLNIKRYSKNNVMGVILWYHYCICSLIHWLKHHAVHDYVLIWWVPGIHSDKQIVYLPKFSLWSDFFESNAPMHWCWF